MEQREHLEHARSGRTRGAEAPLLHDIRIWVGASVFSKVSNRLNWSGACEVGMAVLPSLRSSFCGAGRLAPAGSAGVASATPKSRQAGSGFSAASVSELDRAGNAAGAARRNGSRARARRREAGRPIFPGRRNEEWVLPDPAGQPVEAVCLLSVTTSKNESGGYSKNLASQQLGEV